MKKIVEKKKIDQGYDSRKKLIKEDMDSRDRNKEKELLPLLLAATDYPQRNVTPDREKMFLISTLNLLKAKNKNNLA